MEIMGDIAHASQRMSMLCMPVFDFIGIYRALG